MKKTLKELYEAPSATIVDARAAKIICQSGIPDALAVPDDYELGVDPFDF